MKVKTSSTTAFSLILTLALALAVAGCGGSGSGSTPASNPQSGGVSPAYVGTYTYTAGPDNGATGTIAIGPNVNGQGTVTLTAKDGVVLASLTGSYTSDPASLRLFFNASGRDAAGQTVTISAGGLVPESLFGTAFIELGNGDAASGNLATPS